MRMIDLGITGRPSDNGSLLPARKVQERYDIADRTLDRWLESKALNFPRPVIINKRRYWRIGELVAWERSRVKAAS
jgi:predicted DNA-binding transcriptional regulator AlpA